MQRIFLIVLALFLVWRVLSAFGKRAAKAGFGADSFSRFSPEQRRRRRERDSAGDGARPEELLECLRCGTYVPGGRAFRDEAGRPFCGEPCCRAFETGADHEP